MSTWMCLAGAHKSEGGGVDRRPAAIKGTDAKRIPEHKNCRAKRRQFQYILEELRLRLFTSLYRE